MYKGHEAVKVRAKDDGVTYKPDGCDEGIVGGVFWSVKYRRMSVIIFYANGQADSIPLFELEKRYDILN